ncbi:hypothetical protein ABZ871_00950 [Streptomyces populi]
MIESWVIDDGSRVPVPPEVVRETLRMRADRGQLETWLASSSGRSPAFVTNTERAMVMLLDGKGDPGGHAVAPGAGGSSAGFVLSDGQHDEYPDEDAEAPPCGVIPGCWFERKGKQVLPGPKGETETHRDRSSRRAGVRTTAPAVWRSELGVAFGLGRIGAVSAREPHEDIEVLLRLTERNSIVRPVTWAASGEVPRRSKIVP